MKKERARKRLRRPGHAPPGPEFVEQDDPPDDGPLPMEGVVNFDDVPAVPAAALEEPPRPEPVPAPRIVVIDADAPAVVRADSRLDRVAGQQRALPGEDRGGGLDRIYFLQYLNPGATLSVSTSNSWSVAFPEALTERKSRSKKFYLDIRNGELLCGAIHMFCVTSVWV
jgi:hypothetical protein